MCSEEISFYGGARTSASGGLSKEGAIELQVVIQHSFRRESVAGTLISQVTISTAQVAIIAEHANRLGETFGVIALEVHGSVIPDLAERGDIIGHNCATGKRRLERTHAKRLVTRCGSIDRSPAV